MPYLIPQAKSHSAETHTNNISAPSSMQAFGVIDDTGAPLEEGFHYRGGRLLTETRRLVERYREYEAYEELPGRWFYGGIMHPHFGHFLTETVHRLTAYLDDPAGYDGVVFLKSPWQARFDYNPLELGYIHETLTRLFQLDVDHLLLCESPLHVEELVCVPQLHQLGTPVDKGYLGRLGELEVAYLAAWPSEAPEKVGRKLFLSRNGYLKSGRALGMAAVEEVYAANGFTIVAPETYSFHDQIAMIANATDLVIEAGSALHILDILGYRDASLTVLSRRGPDQGYWRNAYSNRVRSMLFFDSVLSIHDYTRQRPGAGHSLISTGRMQGFLRRAGFVFDEAAFIDRLREATFDDMRTLGLSLPN